MQDKNSFVLYTSYMKHIEMLSREQRGDLFTAIMLYASDETISEMDGMTKMAFSFIKDQLDRDKEKYKAIVEKRREAGSKGGRPKANDSVSKTKKANGFCENQSKAKKPDNEYEYVYEYDNELNNNIVEQSTTEYPYKDSATSEYPYKEVIDYLNMKTGKGFKDKSKDTIRHMKARFKEGYTLDDFKKVIDIKVLEWGTKPEKAGEKDMRSYLRPSTLFGTKFESYLNQEVSASGKGYIERDYNMDELERQLLR